MTLTTATQLTSRARCARQASLGTVGSPFAAATSAVRQSQQQVRGYRFGRLWSSYFDPEYSRNDCRRQRHFRYKYAETLSRRLSWDQNSVAPGTGDAKPVLKRVIKNCWDPMGRIGATADGRVPQNSPDNPEGIRPGQNIEDAERAPLEDLLFGHHHEGQTPKTSDKSKKHRRGQSSLKTSETEADYIIDPITNRKVYKSQGPGMPVRSFKSYRSQFTQFTAPNVSAAQDPIFYDGPPPEAELKKYGQIKLDDSDLGFSLLDALARKHQDVSWHDNRGVVSPKVWSLGPKTSEYTDLHKYNAPLDEQPQPPNQQAAVQYEDLDKYDAVKYQDAYGVLSEQKPTDKYEDLDSYTAFRSHEPDGKYKAEEDSGVVEREDLDKSQAIRSHEPEGKYKDAEDGVNQQYEDLDQYGSVRSHEPDGKYKADQEASVQQYEDLDKYGPVRAYEPDGKYKAQDDAVTKQYEDLDKYGAVKAHEPDGKYKAEADAGVASEIDPEELRQYEAFRSHEPDGLYAASYVKSDLDTEELAQYKPFRSHEPDGKYAAIDENITEDRVEEARYQAFRSHEPDGKYAPGSQVDSTTDCPDLGSYGPFRSHEPDGKYAAEQAESGEQSQELGQYKAVRSHEPDGKYAAQCESCTEVPDLGNHEAFGYEDSETSTLYPSHEIGADLKEYKTVHHNEGDKQTAPHVREDNHGAPIPLEETEKSEYRQLQELLMSEAATEDSTDLPIGNPGIDSANDIPTSSEVLTGRYVRDFPEEFTQSWTSNSAHDSSLLPSDWTLPSHEDSQNHSSKEVDNFLRSPNALESALDRHQKPGRGLAAGKSNSLDPYSKEPQGLETSYLQECGKDVAVIATIYSPAHPASDLPTSAPSTAAEMNSEGTTPTLYKVLAYDPASDTVEIAETTSIVPDNSAPLTPSEVLLRISNPSKFIPHFSALQAQGYEIASGNGDVLIFRKVREALQETLNGSNCPPATEARSDPSRSPSSQPPINPIDMTGGGLRDIDVAASRFASPTGFVNYDLPPLHYTPRSQYPPLQGTESGSDAGQDHTVPDQNTSKTSDESGRRGKGKSLPRRVLVGAVWVGALSYSLAVVGEYFKTGGTDGKGTRGRL